MKFRPLLRGVLSYIPVMEQSLKSLGVLPHKTGGTDTARYCYSVWLRHLSMASKYNLLGTFPKVVAELGPGDSLGIGLAALLSGVNEYYAFDVVEYASNNNNIKLFDELVHLFSVRENIPGDDEFPKVRPILDSYEFPSHILSEDHLQNALRPDRIKSVRDALLNIGRRTEKLNYVSYVVPWDDENILANSSVDMILSQAVLEHIDKLHHTYRAMSNWLRPMGFMSHTIDFKCHGLADKWNGHWAYSDITWKIIKGRRPYLLNREPCSSHLDIIEKNNFRILCNNPTVDITGLSRNQFASRYRQLSNNDLTTSDVYLIAVRD